MQYIDKSTRRAAGNQITEEYLERVCKTEDPLDGRVRYQNIDYQGSFKPYRQRMARELLATQNGLCCYCMRKLTDGQKVTLEHIIPQSASSKAYYQGIGELADNEIILTKQFTAAHKQSFPPYPHTVAYHNLVASCDGTFPDKGMSSQCCNNKRSNADAYPVFYLPDAATRLVYLVNGKVFPANISDPKVQELINAVKLNCTSLVEIRGLWYRLQGCSDAELAACTSDRNRRVETLASRLLTTGGLPGSSSDMIRKYSKDAYWQTFMLYDYFRKVSFMALKASN